MSVTPNQSLKLDLRDAGVLIVENNPGEQDILAQILGGFGTRTPRRSESTAHAMSVLTDESFDLVIVEQALPENDGLDLIHWLRRSAPKPMRTVPVVLLCGHTRRSIVIKARDCGANIVVSKPLSPQVLFDRIIWLGRRPRPFVECEAYIGPDRRFKAFGPPAGMEGRRSTDLSTQIGAATDPNMSQNDIDSMFQPLAVSA
jgi:DNA-binding response OmpR family regulator